MKKIHLLLVEDNILNQKLIKLNLSRYGFEIDIACNGLVAVEKYIKQSYDIIIMDIMMPEMDGYEATQKIRKIEEQSKKRTPIVGLTANTYDSEKERSLQAGMDYFMTKPFDFDLFKQILDSLGLSN